MAKCCYLCNKQMGYFDSGYLAAENTVCEDCWYKYKKVISLAGDKEEFEKELEEFEKQFALYENVEKVVSHLRKVHEAKLEETAEEGQKSKEEEERIAREKREEERLAREKREEEQRKIEAQRRERERIQREYDLKMDNLLNMGHAATTNTRLSI